MQLKEAITNRKSVRRFLDKKPDWRKILKALDYARFAPIAGGQFVLKFIVVNDKSKIEKIGDACQQDFVSQSHCVVVVVSEDEKLKRFFDERGERYARQQAGAAVENFILGLQEQGLSTTWVGHFVDEQIRSILKIPDNVFIDAIFPIGLETKVKTKEKLKADLDKIIYFDKWENKYMEPKTRVALEGV